MNEVWLVSSGSYSDYTVHCAFEREEDCVAYVETYNLNDFTITHDKAVVKDYTPPNAQYKHADPMETCPGCNPYLKDLRNWALRVESLPFHQAGEVPVEPLDSVRW